MTDHMTGVEQRKETAIERADRVIEQAEREYKESLEKPGKLHRSLSSEQETINQKLEQIELDTPVDEVVRLLNRKAALDLLVKADAQKGPPSRYPLDEAYRQRDQVIHSYHAMMERLAQHESELEYLEVVASCFSGNAPKIPYLWLRKRRTNSRQTDAYLRQMISQEIRNASENFDPQKLSEVRAKVESLKQKMEEFGGDRLKTERLTLL